jgi:SAM-dependent methyltransferase
MNTSRLKSLGRTVYRTWRLWIEPERLVMRRAVRGWLRLVPAGSTVLEIGAGTAFMRPVIEAEVSQARYITSDIAPTENTALVVDACALPLADRSVDVVLALEVLEHIERPESLVEEAARVLRADGRLMLTVPFMFGVHDFMDYHRFTPLGMEKLFSRNGIRLQDVQLRGGVFVAATGLVRTKILNTIVGRPKDWRAQGSMKKARWVVSTLVLTPWLPVTLAAYALDRVLDRDSVSPPGYFFLGQRDPTD